MIFVVIGTAPDAANRAKTENGAGKYVLQRVVLGARGKGEFCHFGVQGHALVVWFKMIMSIVIGTAPDIANSRARH